MARGDKLTPKQADFVREYIASLNATQAAIKAGYSEKTAQEQGYQLLRKTSVQQSIEKARARKAEKVELTAEMVLRRIKTEMDSDAADSSPASRLKAAELAAKHLGMLTDKVDVRVNTMTDEEIANELAAIAARSAHHRGS